ncbi:MULTISPECIES: response regulator transcription factor [unclassified Streptomyces]|uniref:response regulator transcription factor n=1 Tax=unclassified Streptomyces TaxID=2593676 RepID=UPI00202DC748|nr:MULTISPECIES: response regulator transcription factor [unclassified Streptomyces]MCM1970530.1 response regulator transcription factor [Streptomyces sp. G1]MCX5127564.1 response regulator transcription factor [Streptomyces sp. NBC_00347]MCX5295018.1 response regulator transcription factor [Streptomyces sp. NBC_00193]
MRVLIVEDERELALMLAEGLRDEGMVCDLAHDGLEALKRTGEADYDVVILDRDLPGLGGDAVCRALAAMGHPARILMLTAADTLSDLVEGLGQGADDYMTKPFSYLELVARLRALGRRTAAGRAEVVLSRHGISLDTVRRVAERDGRPLHLTPKELGVLELLLAADGAPVATEELRERLWDTGLDPATTAVRVTVHALRRKIGDPPLIVHDAGYGYRL